MHPNGYSSRGLTNKNGTKTRNSQHQGLNAHIPSPLNAPFAAFADPEQKRRWFVAGDNHKARALRALRFSRRRLGNAPACASTKAPLSGQYSAPTASAILTSWLTTASSSPSTMAIGDKCVSASLATVEFLPSEDGTDLVFTHQGVFFEGSGGPQMREEGWRKLLSRLI